ncbi:uncharacterized protein LOC142563674 [Dermacentor variabilis]|uniref:uncharacterized protein LOC142563674 n=1 Tax=Dermacentor variabilis TaxID=34621 RepID=UPI003F5BBEAA
MTSFMMRHFKPYCWICLASGLVIFRGLRATAQHKTDMIWKASYLFYAFICFVLLIVVTAFFFYQMTVTFLIGVQVFTRWLYLLVFTVVGFKVLLNLLCIALKSRHLFDFFKQSARYESSVNFVPPECCRQTKSCYFIRLIHCLAFVGNLSLSSYLLCNFIDNLEYSGTQGVVLKVSGVAGDFIFYVYQMVDFIVLRPCLEVLLLYIRQQHEVVRCMIDGGGSLVFVKRARNVEEIRMNLCAIALLKTQLNGIWRWSIMLSGGAVLLFACICTYTVFVEGLSTLQSVICLLYSVLLLLDILDITGLSQEMVNELRSMRQTLQSAPTGQQNGAYFTQISYLRDTIKPKEMAVSGAGFFSLNFPLLVSLAGSAITYTVILVQTSESVKTTAK